MPIIKITKSDLMKTKNVSTGWWGAKIIKIYPPAKSKAGDSVNYPIDFELEDNPKHGQNANGKVITKGFNSKLIGMLGPLFDAIGIKVIDDNYDTDLLLGKKCDVKVVQTSQGGLLYDNIDAFLPYGKGQEGSPF